MESKINDDASVPGPALTELISSYPILTSLAASLSALDLYHLALTNHTHHALILTPANIFATLRASTLCDGRGLARRRTFNRERMERTGSWARGWMIEANKQIAINLSIARCGEADWKPCIKCGLNICEECRLYPRSWSLHPRPHESASGEAQNIMVLCPPCDAAMEDNLVRECPSETCDCDIYERWICHGCHNAELEFTNGYFDKHTIFEYYGESDCEDCLGDDGCETHGTKFIRDHQHDRWFWCQCGANVRQDNPVRCTLCKRRHLGSEEW